MRERLATLTSFAGSRALALSLIPATTLEGALELQQFTREAGLLLASAGYAGPSIDDRVPDLVRAAGLGGLLTPEELEAVRGAVDEGPRSRTLILARRQECPALASLVEEIVPLRALSQEIRRCLGEGGQVADEASTLLGPLRRQAREAHDRLMHRLNEFLASPRHEAAMQEPIVTLRGGRYVVPVKAEMRRRIRGVVHDVSSSGATVFVEPLATLELNNRWRELQSAVEEEEQRVLWRLSRLVGHEAEVIARNIELLARLDLSGAAARLALDMRAILPALLDGAEVAEEAPGPPLAPPWQGGEVLELREARHPLLQGEVVPLSVRLGGGVRCLVITGPNTGGKTVALKTVGLLSLMAQAGLAIPAGEGTRLPVFEGVFADIGDEQSLAQSLSTFGSHMATIVAVVGAAGPGTLVLLDELGAGTDPAEGSALARAILQHLVERGSLVVATTHHGEIKAFVARRDGMANAHMEFDPQSLTPTYRLSVGLPGPSQALPIARRIGLPAEILEEARHLLGAGAPGWEALLSDAQEERGRVAEELGQAQRQAEEARTLEREWRERLERIIDEREALLRSTRQELGDAVEEVLDELKRLRRGLRTAPAGQAATSAPELEERMRAATSLRTRVRLLGRAVRPSLGVVGAVEVPALRVGGWARQRSTGLVGQVVRLGARSAAVEVRVGHYRVLTDRDDMEAVAPPAAGSAGRTPVAVSAAPLPSEWQEGRLDLHGLRAEEAEEACERFLQAAFMAGHVQVVLLHGRGQGVLRAAVRRHLAGHALVRQFRPAEAFEGGEGATVVLLEERVSPSRARAGGRSGR